MIRVQQGRRRSRYSQTGKQYIGSPYLYVLVIDCALAAGVEELEELQDLEETPAQKGRCQPSPTLSRGFSGGNGAMGATKRFSVRAKPERRSVIMIASSTRYTQRQMYFT
jgi:hypothetical protein